MFEIKLGFVKIKIEAGVSVYWFISGDKDKS